MRSVAFLRRPGRAFRCRPGRVAATGLLLAALLVPLPAAATGPVAQMGYGMASAIGSLVYGPTKVAYALGGGLIAGFAYLFSGGDGAVAEPIIDAAMRGDYVIEPAHLRGERDLHFIGRRPDHEAARDVASGPPDEEY